MVCLIKTEIHWSAVWLRIISIDGGLYEHDKKVAIKAFTNFLEYRPDFAEAIAMQDTEKRRKNFKVVK